MRHVIIFDGPDGCGKTNISLALSQIINVPYFKNESEWEHFEKNPDYFANTLKYADPYFTSYLKQTGSSIILDRAYPSEWVYGQAFGRQTSLKDLRFSDSAYYHLGARIILPFRSSYSNVRDQFSSIDEKKLVRIDELYRDFCEWTWCSVLRINVDSEDLNWQLFEILKFINDPNPPRIQISSQEST